MNSKLIYFFVFIAVGTAIVASFLSVNFYNGSSRQAQFVDLSKSPAPAPASALFSSSGGFELFPWTGAVKDSKYWRILPHSLISGRTV